MKVVDNNNTNIKAVTSILPLLQKFDPLLSCFYSIFEVHPVKASFVEFTIQECPEGAAERGSCQRQILNSDTEVAGILGSGF